MSGDINLNEQIMLAPQRDAYALAARAVRAAGGRVIHRYGESVAIVESAPGAAPSAPAGVSFAPARSALAADVVEGTDEVGQLGLAAFELRNAPEYAALKRNRPRQGEPWEMHSCTDVYDPRSLSAAAAVPAGAAPTSAYLEGSVALGIIIVEGPTADLQFSAAEQTKVVAEVQNGLSYFAGANPGAALSFSYDIHTVRLATVPVPGAADLEAVWRDPAMAALGYSASWSGVGSYVEDIRTRLGTRWTYCVFFTKYPLAWFGYASIGGPRIVMDYAQDGWGPDNIDRVFAHETGHIFGAPDEYGSSGCACGGAWGRFGAPNGNCEGCAPGGGVMCLMKGNDWAQCRYTPYHLGWAAPPVADYAPLFARHSGAAVDIYGIDPNNGAAAIQWEYWGGDNQLFWAIPVEDGYYRFVAKHSGRVLDVEGISTANGARIQQWDWWGGDNQKFRPEAVGDGYYRLVAKHSGKVIDVSGISSANGAQLVQWDWWGGDNQKWRVGHAPLISRHSGKALDVSGIAAENGAPIVQWDYWNGDNQEFRLEPLGDGYFRVVALHSGRVLDVEGISADNGARIIQWDWWGGDNQRFRPEAVGDGYYRLVAKHSGRVLDVSGISADNGAQIVQWDWWGGDNQKWRL